MTANKSRTFIIQLVSLAIVSMGFAQVSGAAMIGTEYLLESNARDASIARMEQMLAREDVARQLVAYGVEPTHVIERIQGMSNAELVALEGRLDKQVAGGDALAVIGTVFVVLLILELVGVTDIFKSI